MPSGLRRLRQYPVPGVVANPFNSFMDRLSVGVPPRGLRPAEAREDGDVLKGNRRVDGGAHLTSSL